MHHYQSMNQAWSWALGPYYNVNLTCYLLDPLADVLYKYEDPYRKTRAMTFHRPPWKCMFPLMSHLSRTSASASLLQCQPDLLSARPTG